MSEYNDNFLRLLQEEALREQGHLYLGCRGSASPVDHVRASARGDCGCHKQPQSPHLSAPILLPSAMGPLTSGKQTTLGQLITEHLDRIAAGDRSSRRWMEMMIQGLGISRLPARRDIHSPLQAGLFDDKVCQSSNNCTPHQAPCKAYLFSPFEPFGGCAIPYIANANGGHIDSGDPDNNIDRVIISLHGSGPNSSAFGEYYNTTMALSYHFDLPAVARTVVICPQFQTEGNNPYTDLWNFVSFWQKDEDYISAKKSVNEIGIPFSSYDYLDALIQRASWKYPKAKNYIVMGHSGGGQLTHRYAVLDAGIGIWLWNFRGARIRYISYNPFGYAFLTPSRRIFGTTTPPLCGNPNAPDPNDPGWHWGIPQNAPGYNNWPYGLQAAVAGSDGRATKAFNTRFWSFPEATLELNLSNEEFLRYAYTRRDIYHFQATLDADDYCGAGPPGIEIVQQGYYRPMRFASFRDSFDDVPAFQSRFIGIAEPLTHMPDCGVDWLTHGAGYIYRQPASLSRIMDVLG